MTKERKRVCIIGAGPCGLAQLRAFQSEESNLGAGEMPDLVCYEKQADWGGMWNNTWRIGLDEHGEKVHSGMYRNLWSNGPKECLEFADYTFEEHFGKAIPSYPPRPVMYDYIQGRAEKAGLRKFIQFETVVNRVDYDIETEKFMVTAHSFKEKKVTVEKFDFVVVAIGHFSTPDVPYFKGFENFDGRILHAHDFRNAKEFKGKSVLVIGSSYSAEDIGSQCYKYGASEIICSYRSAPMDFTWPKTFSTYPLLTKVVGRTAHFANGKTHNVDAIILCTGYLHSFPFIVDSSLNLETDNCLWPVGLYRGIFWEKNPKLMYLGMQDQWYTFNMFDVQAWVARDFMLGRTAMPSLEDMKKDSLKWSEAEAKAATAKDKIIFQGDYIKDLLKDSNYPQFDVDKMNETFFGWKHDKEKNIMAFRDIAYPSVITGTPSPVHHTPWLKAFDDSLESYLQPSAEADAS